MSDDVKVKFSGDFTDVSKGATDASKKAGTAMSAWVGEYTKSLKDSLVGAVALGSIVDTFVGNFKKAFESFKEIDSMSRKLGVSRVELQQFSKVGKEFNIDMESMGRTISFANKVIGGAALGHKDAQKILMELGYTQNEVTAGNIQAIGVIQKLSENYEANKKAHGETIAQNILSKQATEAFGRTGADLIPIIKEGTEAMKERIKTMKIYSEEEVKSGARAARQLEKGQKKFAWWFGGRAATSVGSMMEQSDISDLEEEFLKKKNFNENWVHIGDDSSMSGKLDILGKKTGVKKKDLNKEFNEFLLARAKAMGMDAGDLADVLASRGTQSFGWIGDEGKDISEKRNAFYLNQSSMAANAQADKDKAEKAAAANTLDLTAGGGLGNVPVLAASSLQQIGGGDIASVAGLYHGNVEDYTRRTAEATEKMVAQDTPASKKITSVAK